MSLQVHACSFCDQYLFKLVNQTSEYASLPSKSNSRCLINLYKCSLSNYDYQFFHLLPYQNEYIWFSHALTIYQSFLNIGLHNSFLLRMSTVRNKYYLMSTVTFSEVFLWLIEICRNFFRLVRFFMFSPHRNRFSQPWYFLNCYLLFQSKRRVWHAKLNRGVLGEIICWCVKVNRFFSQQNLFLNYSTW